MSDKERSLCHYQDVDAATLTHQSGGAIPLSKLWSIDCDTLFYPKNKETAESKQSQNIDMD